MPWQEKRLKALFHELTPDPDEQIIFRMKLVSCLVSVNKFHIMRDKL